MNPRHALLVAVVAGAWCLTPPAHASSNNGQGQGRNGNSQINSMIASPANNSGSAVQGFAENGESGLVPGASAPRAHGAAPGNCGPSGNGNNAGAGASDTDCGTRPNSAGSPGENGQSGLGWQSLLPGSIQ